jgi:murein L,D-transpeptidase YafK
MVMLHAGAAVGLRKPLCKDNHWYRMVWGLVRRSGSIALIRASLVRALTVSAIIAGSLTLAGCYGEDGYQLPTKAMKELSPQMLAMLEQKNMPKDSPILVRIFKEESELEVWKQDTTGHFQILKVYPICRWSGDLGPKVNEGDRQAPEGFYPITPALMNPNSNYYLAINTGFPNAYDKANDRHGAFLMIHGDCSSRGCYAMTDEQIGEIYSLAREALLGGQQSFQIQAYPFRMTPANLARHRTNPNMAFWRMLKIGNDHFEATHLEPKVDVCDRHYVFDAAQPGSTKSVIFNPTGRCPPYVVNPEVAGPALEKSHADDVQYAQLVKANVWAAPIHSGLDGGMNRVFLAQVGGNIPPARVPPPGANALPPQPPPVVTADNGGTGPTLANKIFGGFFGSTQTQVAAAETATPEAAATTGTAPKAKPRAESGTVAEAKPKTLELRKTETAKSEAQPQHIAAAKPKPAPQQEANAAAPPATVTMNGAQQAMPTGSFDSRWGGLQ